MVWSNLMSIWFWLGGGLVRIDWTHDGPKVIDQCVYVVSDNLRSNLESLDVRVPSDQLILGILHGNNVELIRNMTKLRLGLNEEGSKRYEEFA